MPVYMSVFLFSVLFPSLSLSLPVSVSVCLFLCLSVSVCPCLLCLSMSVCLSLCLLVCLSLSLCISKYAALCLCLSTSLFHPLKHDQIKRVNSAIFYSMSFILARLFLLIVATTVYQKTICQMANGQKLHNLKTHKDVAT
jgi:hypothetical protein